MVRDITDRRRAKEALEEAKQATWPASTTRTWPCSTCADAHQPGRA